MLQLGKCALDHPDVVAEKQATRRCNNCCFGGKFLCILAEEPPFCKQTRVFLDTSFSHLSITIFREVERSSVEGTRETVSNDEAHGELITYEI